MSFLPRLRNNNFSFAFYLRGFVAAANHLHYINCAHVHTWQHGFYIAVFH